MKTASSDEELAFKQKERDVAMYTRKAGMSVSRPRKDLPLYLMNSDRDASLVLNTLLDNVSNPSVDPGAHSQR